MDKMDKIEERKRLNAPFTTAFDWICQTNKLTQQALATQLLTSGSLISFYRNGRKLAGADIKDRLVQEYPHLFRPYLDGISPYMLAANVPDEEFIRISQIRDNPDYEIMQQIKVAPTPDNGESSIIELYATLIKELEAMRRDLASELEQVRQIKYELTNEREAIHSIVQQLSTVLSHSRAQYTIDEGDRYRVAADKTN